MLKYLEFLMETAPLAGELERARNLMVPDSDATKVLLHALLTTELKGYVTPLIDYPLRPYIEGINTTLDLVLLDRELKNFGTLVTEAPLKHIFLHHNNTIFRIAAFLCSFLVKADKEFKK